MDNENKQLACLEKILGYYDKVFLINISGKEDKTGSVPNKADVDYTDSQNLLSSLVFPFLSQELPEIAQPQRILILSSTEKFNQLVDTEEKKFEENSHGKDKVNRYSRNISYFIEYRKIKEEEADFLTSLYNMYEFSNRFFLISREEQYGNLFHFIDMGLLTVEEVAKAFLH